MNSEKSKQAWCMVCNKRRSIKDMNLIPAIGYTCKKKFNKTCKRKEHILIEVERMRQDPKLKHLFMSESEKSLYREIEDFKEWLRNKDLKSCYTHEGSYVDIPIIIKELDKRFPVSLSNVERRLDKNKGGR